jgi:hypothetical protein
VSWWLVLLVALGGDVATGVITAWVTIAVIRRGLGADSSPRA